MCPPLSQYPRNESRVLVSLADLESLQGHRQGEGTPMQVIVTPSCHLRIMADEDPSRLRRDVLAQRCGGAVKALHR